MTRRGDPVHTYARLAKELQDELGDERLRYVERELGNLWGGMNDAEREQAPVLPPAAQRPGTGLPAEAFLSAAERAALRAAAEQEAAAEAEEPDPEDAPQS